MLDVLHSVELVTANGTLLHVSQRSNPELFWGIKGAGFNFGIVVSAKFRVFDATYGGSVMEGDMAFPASINESFWEVVKTFDSDGKLDPKLSLVSVLSFSPKTNSVRRPSLALAVTDHLADEHRAEHQLFRIQ